MGQIWDRMCFFRPAFQEWSKWLTMPQSGPDSHLGLHPHSFSCRSIAGLTGSQCQSNFLGYLQSNMGSHGEAMAAVCPAG
eukprot:1140791-Pelagomonas_calceolata.AAC.7